MVRRGIKRKKVEECGATVSRPEGRGRKSWILHLFHWWNLPTQSISIATRSPADTAVCVTRRARHRWHAVCANRWTSSLPSLVRVRQTLRKLNNRAEPRYRQLLYVGDVPVFVAPIPCHRPDIFQRESSPCTLAQLECMHVGRTYTRTHGRQEQHGFKLAETVIR